MSALARLQQWFRERCNGQWEHSFGVTITTLDNPGWLLEIDLADTELQEKPFEPVYYGVGENAEASGDEWIDCKVEDGQFLAAGGPLKIEEMIQIFLDWANS